MRPPLAALLTYQHYELLAWDSEADAQAQHIAEAAWGQLEHKLAEAQEAVLARPPGINTPAHTPLLPCLSQAFEAAYAQAVRQRLLRMAQDIQASNTCAWHWSPDPLRLPLHPLPAWLPHGLSAADCAQASAQWHTAQANTMRLLHALALEHLQRDLLNYQQALTRLRTASAQCPANPAPAAYPCTTG